MNARNHSPGDAPAGAESAAEERNVRPDERDRRADRPIIAEGLPADGRAGASRDDAEMDILLRCAREAVGGRIVERKPPHVDPDRLLSLARRHGMIGLLHAWRSSRGTDLGEDVATRLSAAATDSARQNLLLTGVLLRTVAILRDSGIDALAYKGPALAAGIYGNLALRPSVDLDVLVRRDDVAPAVNALCAAGYRALESYSGEELRRLVAYGCEYQFESPGERVLVELQWALTPRFFALDLVSDAWFARAVAVPLGGSQVAALGAEDLLLALCIHGAKHAWQRLMWVCDIAQWLRRNRDADWNAVLANAGRAGAMRVLLVALVLARDVVGAEIPEQLLARTGADRQSRRLAASLAARLYSNAPECAGSKKILLDLRMRERMRDRVRYVARLALTPGPGEWKLVRLPRNLAGLYWLVRPVRLLGRLFSSLLRRSEVDRDSASATKSTRPE